MQSSRNKRRDMARSILPSTSRSSGKNIQRLKRSNRRDVRAGLRSMVHDPDPLNDDWDDRTDFGAYPDAEINMLVRWRRNSDKLNHFERWAVALTKDQPIEDRLSYMRGILPDGLIGDHAMSHLRDRDELSLHTSWHSMHVRRWHAQQAPRAKQERYRRRRVGWAVTCAMQNGSHKQLNSVLKQVDEGELEPPLLRHTNAHDFVDELYAQNRFGSLIYRAALVRLITFLDAERYVEKSTVLPATHDAGTIYH